jgi:hypothetical protein
MSNDHWEMPNAKAQMPKGKIQMTNDGGRNTSTRVNVKVQSWEPLENRKNELRAKGNSGNKLETTQAKGQDRSPKTPETPEYME